MPLPGSSFQDLLTARADIIVKPGDIVLYDIGEFIVGSTDIGDRYCDHIAGAGVTNVFQHHFESYMESRTHFKYVVPARIIKLIPKTPEFSRNDRAILEVRLPGVQVCNRAFETNSCAVASEHDADLLHIRVGHFPERVVRMLEPR